MSVDISSEIAAAQAAELAASRTLAIPLLSSIVVAGRRLDELVFREPRVIEVRTAERAIFPDSLPEASRAYAHELLAKVAGVELPVIEALPVRKLNKAWAFVGGFIRSKRAPDWRPDPNIEDERIVPLDPVLTVDGRDYPQLFLREPTGAEVKRSEAYLRGRIGNQAVRYMQIGLVASISGLPVPVVEQLPISRLVEAYEYSENFTGAGLPTGET